MKIASATLRMSAQHQFSQQRAVTESLDARVGRRLTEVRTATPRPVVDISPQGQARQSGESHATGDESDAVALDPHLQVIRSMMEMLFGKKLAVFDARELERANADTAAPAAQGAASEAAPNATTGAGFGLEYRRHESYSESESTRFSAEGTVRTADGKEIAFQLQLSMARSYQFESDTVIQMGDAVRKKDPLVINFDGTAAQLNDTRFAFDVDADGQDEQINSLGAGSGFLALDRNRDGQVNDGSELFGARSGDGFAELAAYDGDGNGWIDESDAVYQDLRVWRDGASGRDRLQTLSQAGVGALSLARTATPFAINDGNNRSKGEIRASGVYLHEDGSVGTLQQVDLSV